jgi:hypothetical protein
VSGDNDVVGGETKTAVTFVVSVLSEDIIPSGLRCQVVSGFGGVIRIAGTTEHA